MSASERDQHAADVPAGSSPARFWIWAGLIGSPLLILTHEQFGYSLVAFSCGHFDALNAVLHHLVPVVFIATTVLFALMSWRTRERSGLPAVSVMASGVSVISTLSLLAQWLPVFYLHPCMRL